VLIAAYLGWERPVREIPTAIDNTAEDAAFADAMRAFGDTKPQAFNPADLIGDR